MSNNISSGFGTGSGNIGTNFQSTPFELETTAAKTEVKKELNLVPGLNPDPLLNQTLTKPSQDPYSSSSSQPRLPSPLTKMRLSSSDLSNQNQNWQSLYDQLEDTLPAEIKKALLNERSKPFQDRLPSLVILNNLLVAISKALLQLENGANTSPENLGSDLPFQERTLTYQAMLPLAEQGAVENFSLMTNQTMNYLQGHLNENPYADQLISVLHYINDSLTALSHSQTPEEIQKGANDHQAWLSYFAESIQNQLSQANQDTPGYHIVETSLSTLNLVSTAASLATMGAAPSLYLGSAMSLIGLKDGDLPTIGPHLSQTSRALAEAAASFLSDGAQKTAYRNGFDTFFTAILALGSGLIHHIAHEGLKPLPSEDLDESIRFSSQLTQSFLAHTELIKKTFESLAHAFNPDGVNQSLIGHLFSLTGTILMAKIADTDQKNYDAHLEAVKAPLQKDLAALHEALNTQTSSTGRSLNAFVQQGRAALDHEDFEGFNQAFENALNILGIDKNQLQNDVNHLSNATQNALQRAKMEDSTQMITTLAESA